MMHERDRDLVQTQPVTLQDAGEFEQDGLVTALRLPDGKLLMVNNYKHEAKASGATLGVYAKMLNAEQVVVHGKWKFIPDTEIETIKDE